MLTTLIRTSWGAVVLAGLAAAVPSAAFADGFGNVDCRRNPHSARCTISVGTPGRPAGNGTGGGRGNGSGSGSDASGPSPCHYVAVQGQGPPPAGRGPGGGWYMRVCTFTGGALGDRPVWLDDPPAPVDPAVLARHAVSQLRLPAPGIRTNPSTAHDVLMQVPVWLWVAPATWGPRSSTAAVPGMSITATATPTTVRWQLGDGSTVTCTGAGTPWRSGTDPKAASPTCGHVYRRSSAGAPRQAFTLRATVAWSVSWVGGGRNGVLPAMTTTSQTRVRVAKSEAINGGTP